MSIQVNPHRIFQDTIEQYTELKDWPASDIEACILKDSLVVIRFYPLCASGFYESVKPTIEEAAKEIVEMSAGRKNDVCNCLGALFQTVRYSRK